MTLVARRTIYRGMDIDTPKMVARRWYTVRPIRPVQGEVYPRVPRFSVPRVVQCIGPARDMAPGWYRVRDANGGGITITHASRMMEV